MRKCTSFDRLDLCGALASAVMPFYPQNPNARAPVDPDANEVKWRD